MNKVKRKGRTLDFTINELMESKRLEIAIDMFHKDPLLLKAIFVELGLESLMVGRNTVIKKVNTYDLPKYELVPYLRTLDVDDFTTFNLFWGLTPVERELYLAKVNGASAEEMERLVDRVNNKLGITKLLEDEDN